MSLQKYPIFRLKSITPDSKFCRTCGFRQNERNIISLKQHSNFEENRAKFEKNPIRSIGGEQYKSNQITRHSKFQKIWSKYYVFISISIITYLGKMNELVKLVFSV